MTTDEQLLSRVRSEAARRIRRRRAVLSVAAVAAIVGLSAAAMAATDRDGTDEVHTFGPDVTATTATTSTSAAPSTTAPTTSTTTPTTSTAPTTTSTTIPPTTTLPPIAPVTVVNQTGGIKATVTASQDRSRPGQVELTIRVEDGHGGSPTGYVLWDQAAYTMWGQAGQEEGVGDFPAWLFGECDEVMDEDPETNLGPDPAATAIDRTTVLRHDYGSLTGVTQIRVEVYTSLCSTDEESTPVEIIVPL